MKHEIIYTEDCALIVSDEEIKPGDFNVPSDCNKSSDISRTSEEDLAIVNDKFNGYKKIIGHRPFTRAAILEGIPLLPESSQEDDVEELAKNKFPYLGSEQVKSDQNRHTDTLRHGFKTGYNKAKETYKFTENDLRKAMEASRDIRYVTYSEEEIIQSIQQPKLPQYFGSKEQKDCPYDFTSRCTMDRCDCKTKLKTTTNVQGYTVLEGDYIYE
jgi:hypothetical protein